MSRTHHPGLGNNLGIVPHDAFGGDVPFNNIQHFRFAAVHTGISTGVLQEPIVRIPADNDPNILPTIQSLKIRTEQSSERKLPQEMKNYYESPFFNILCPQKLNPIYCIQPTAYLLYVYRIILIRGTFHTCLPYYIKSC